MAKEKPHVRLEMVDPSKLKQGPIRHTGLDPFLTAWAHQLFTRVGHFVHPSFEQWELGFLRDMNPQDEMLVWEAIAGAVDAYVSEHPEARSQETVNRFSAISMGARFKQETPETEAMRALWLDVWERIQADPVKTLAKIQRSLDKGAGED